MAENIDAISSDIAELERRLAEKRAALEGAKEGEPHSPETIKEEAHQMMGEKIIQQAPTYPIKALTQAKATDDKSYDDPAIKQKVDELIALTETNLEEAIKQAVATNNEAIIDAFHDKIADHLTQHLIESKQLSDL